MAKLQKQWEDKSAQDERNISDLNMRLMQYQGKQLDNTAGSALTARALTRLRERERELNSTVAKLVLSEEASEASFTCFTCMRIYTLPVTCIPCGHSYCKECIQKTGFCAQCGRGVEITYYANELLADLSTRYVFRKQALAAIKRMTVETLESTSNSTARSSPSA